MFCGRKNVTKLEKLQERALRFVFKDNNSSYADLLKRGNFLSLSAYRIRNLAMEVFKCFHGMNPMYLNNLFCKQEIKYDLRDLIRATQILNKDLWLQFVQILWIKIMECSSF